MTKVKKYGLYLILAQSFALICAAQADLIQNRVNGNKISSFQKYDASNVTNYLNCKTVLKDFIKIGTSLRSFDEKTGTISGATSGVPNGFNVSAVASGFYPYGKMIKRKIKNIQVRWEC